MLVSIEKKCLNCDKPVRGRSDKKFCNDACRNNYNNQHRETMPDMVRRINSVLLKNYQLLTQQLGDDGKRKVCREQLALRGFHFGYHTHTYTTKRGHCYYFCYNHGWLDLNESILVVRSTMEI